MNFSHAMTLRVLPLALACLTALTVQAQGLRPSGGGAMRLPSAAGVLPPAGGAASAAVALYPGVHVSVEVQGLGQSSFRVRGDNRGDSHE